MKLVDHQRLFLDETTERWVDIYVYENLNPALVAVKHPAGVSENVVTHEPTYDIVGQQLIVRQKSEIIFD